MTASATASANHAYQATLSSHVSSGTNSARPNASPQQNEPRRLRPVSAMTSSAGPRTTTGQASSGGKETNTAIPPTIEMSSAQGRPSPAHARLCVVPETGPAWADITLAA